MCTSHEDANYVFSMVFKPLHLIYGTLIDSSEGITKSAQYALSHFGISEPDRNSLFFFIGPPLINTFMEHYGFTKERALEAVEKYRERYNKIGIFECSLFPGVKECIEAVL